MRNSQQDSFIEICLLNIEIKSSYSIKSMCNIHYKYKYEDNLQLYLMNKQETK